MPIFKRDRRLLSEKFTNFITSSIIMVQCRRGNFARLHLCVFWRTVTLSECRCKEAPVNQPSKEGCSTTRDIQTIGA
jgi:hypothetical protein